MIPAVIAAGLETALDQLRWLDPEVAPRLAALKGKVIAIELEGLGFTFYLLPGAGDKVIQVLDRYDGEPVARIRGAPLALARQWRSERSSGDGLTVEGDAVVAREFQAILAQLDIDWEEQLSNIIGDAAAHQLGNLWRGFRDGCRRAADILLRDGGEYLQQESRALPPRPAVERFLCAVDTLREDADRLAARIERLRRRVTAGDPA